MGRFHRRLCRPDQEICAGLAARRGNDIGSDGEARRRRLRAQADRLGVAGRRQGPYRSQEFSARPQGIGREIDTGTVFMNRCDYLDPALTWTGVKDTGRGATLSVIGYEALTRAKSFHLRTKTS